MLLPSTIIPKHYHLHLKFPDPNDGNLDTSSPLQFEAVVTINVTVKVATSCIVLHTGKFEFSSITLDVAAISNNGRGYGVVEYASTTTASPTSHTVGQ
eukprot:gene7859-32476_t